MDYKKQLFKNIILCSFFYWGPLVTSLALGGDTYRLDNTQTILTTEALTPALTYDFNEHWGIEGSIGAINVANLDNNTSAPDDEDATRGVLYTIDGIYRFSPFSVFQPYVLAGIGILGLTPNGPDNLQSGNINAGIGTQFFLNDVVAIRGEIRDIYATTSGYKNDYNINFGVSFILGGNKSSSKPTLFNNEKY